MLYDSLYNERTHTLQHALQAMMSSLSLPREQSVNELVWVNMENDSVEALISGREKLPWHPSHAHEDKTG